MNSERTFAVRLSGDCSSIGSSSTASSGTDARDRGVTEDGVAPPVGIEEIEAAARRVAPHVNRTPMLDGSELGAGPLWVKAEIPGR